MIVSIPARARMRPAHQLARAQHQLAGRDVGAPDPLLNSAAVERRLRRAVQRGKITVRAVFGTLGATLDVFVADLLESKLRLIGAVESEEVPNASVPDELYAKLRSLDPALLQENKASQATGELRDRLEALAKSGAIPQVVDALLL
jgi:hypothetical protein